MRKLVCKDTTCRHHGANNVCQKKVVEIKFAKCQSYEKGFYYYIFKALDALQNTNMISLDQLDEDMRIGAFYVMEIYNLAFSQHEHGYWRWVMLTDKETNKGLMADDITNRPINLEALAKHMIDFDNGILPGQDQEKEEPKKTSQPFGWLSPTGEFTEGDWGEHEGVAAKIIEQKNFYEEFKNKRFEYNCYDARDFLSEVKGYALIHNPCGDGGYIVSHVKPLTKKQKEFLYGYFMDIGDKWKAEQYLND